MTKFDRAIKRLKWAQDKLKQREQEYNRNPGQKTRRLLDSAEGKVWELRRVAYELMRD